MGITNFMKDIFQRKFLPSMFGMASGSLVLPISAGYLGLSLTPRTAAPAAEAWSRVLTRALMAGGMGGLGGLLCMTLWQCGSSMFLNRKESELQLSLWVEQMQTRNNSLHSRFRDCHVDNRFDKMDHCIFAVDENSTQRDSETQQMISYGNSILNTKIDENTASVRSMFDGFGSLQSAIEAKVLDLQAELMGITQSQKDLHSRFYSFQSFGRSNFASMQARQKLISKSLRVLDSSNNRFQNSIRQSIADGVAAITRLDEGQQKIRITIEDTNSKLTFMTTLVQESVQQGGGGILGGQSPTSGVGGGLPRIKSSLSSPGLSSPAGYSLSRHNSRGMNRDRANSPLEEIE
jgi:hypothetical protein